MANHLSCFFTFIILLSLAPLGCGGGEENADPVPTTDPAEITQNAIKKQEIGAFEEAIEILNQALKVDPRFVPGHYRKGQVYEEWDKREEAVEAYQKTLAIEPEHIGARLGLGSAYAKLTKNELAIEEYKKVAKARPTDPEIPFKIALEYWYIQDIPSAAEFYKQVIDIQPDHLQAHLNLASVYERMEDWQKAIREIEIAKRLGEETGNPQAIAIAEKKLPFIQSKMNVTQPDIKRKSEPPFD